jgi:hypothetical protein
VNIFEPAIWICGQTRCFTNDVQTLCKDCDVCIYHRPHATPTAMKLCIACSLIRRGLDGDRMPILTTREVIEEVQRFYK